MITVLYVDDEPGLLEVAQIFLEQTDEFKVGISTSATKALASPQILSYDAIISDYQMPGMDGIAFLKAVRERSTEIPFILFTGRGREEVVIEAINNGADFYLQKGGSPEAQFAELAHKIRQAVRRKQAERSLHDSERRLSDIIDFLPDATFAIDRSGHVIAWNRAIEEMTGIPAGEMLGKGDYAYAVPFYGSPRPILIDLIDETDEKISQFYTNISRNDISLSAETDLPHPKGDQITVLTKVCHLFNQAGEITGTIESIRDITGRKNLEMDLERKHGELQASYEHLAAAEEELREQYDELAASEQQIRTNEERLVMAQKIGCTGSWEYNIVLNEIWGSSEGLHIFGFHRDAGYVPIDDIEACIIGREQVHQALVDLITEGREYNLEYAINPADGSLPRMIHSIARLDKDAGGRAVKVTGVIQDITERKRAEEESVLKNAILKTQQETSLDAILIVDENGKILDYNRRFIEIWGVPEDLVAQRIDEPVLQYVLKQLADPEAFHSRVKYLYEHKEEKSFEELLLKDGRVLERFSAPMLGETGKYYGRIWYFRDITQRKRALAALNESEERLGLFIRHAPAALAMFDRDMRYLAASYRWIADYHLGGLDILGRSHYEIFPEITEALKTVHRRCLAGEVLSAKEEKFEREDGLVQWVSWEARPWYKTGNTIGGIIIFSEDITVRRLTQEALRASEEKYRLLTENSVDIIYSMDLEGRITHISPQVTRYGYTPDQLISHTISEVIAEEDLSRVQEDIKKTIDTEKPTRTIFRLKGSPENPVWFEDNGTVIKKADGVAVGISGILRDITERVKAETALRESEGRLRRLAENAPDMIYRMSLPDGRYEYVSPASLAMTGYTPEEFSSDPGLITRIIHPDWHEYFRKQWGALLENKAPSFYEYQIIDRAGNTRWFNQRNMLVSDDEGKPVAIEGIVTDITRQKNTERELRRSELRSLALSENAGSWIWEVDAEGLYRYSIPAVYKILGYRPDELVGKMHFYDLFDPAVRENLKTVALSAFGSHEPFRDFVNTNRHKNGTPVILSTGGSPVFDDAGTFSGYCGVDENITGRKQAEEDLRQAHKKLHLLSGITRHDISNQLLALNGFVGLLHKKVPDPALENYFTRIRDASNQITAMIAFTKEYEKIGVHAPVWQVLAAVVNEAGTGILPGQIMLKNDLAASTEVFADPLIVKAIFNLLDNSIRHGIRVTEIRVSSHQSGENLVVVWEDNGIGIAAEEKEQIFEPGFGKNTGLGMFLVREILSLTGIRIQETGEPGTGARFEMVVPEGAYRTAPE